MALDFQGISTQRKFGQSRLGIQPGLAQQAKLDNDARAVKNAVLEQKRTERLGRRAYRAALRGQDPTRYIQGIDALEKMRAIHGSSGAGINIAGSQEQGLSTHIGNTRAQLDAFNAFKRDLGNSELIRSGDEGALSRAVKRGAELGMSPGEVREWAGVGPRQAGASQPSPATTTTPAATDFDKDGNGIPDSFQASRVPIDSSPSAPNPSGQVTRPSINAPQVDTASGGDGQFSLRSLGGFLSRLLRRAPGTSASTPVSAATQFAFSQPPPSHFTPISSADQSASVAGDEFQRLTTPNQTGLSMRSGTLSVPTALSNAILPPFESFTGFNDDFISNVNRLASMTSDDVRSNPALLDSVGSYASRLRGFIARGKDQPFATRSHLSSLRRHLARLEALESLTR